QQHIERAPDEIGIQLARMQEHERARPVDRLAHRRKLLQVERAQSLHEGDELPAQPLLDFRHPRADDALFKLRVGARNVKMQTAPLQRVANLARIVGGKKNDRRRARLDRAKLRDRDLTIRKKFEQKRLELVIRLVEFVDEQYRSARLPQRLEKRTRLQKFLIKESIVELVQPRDRLLEPLGARHQIAELFLEHLRVEKLLAIFPLVKRLGFIEPLIALKADKRLADKLRRRLGKLRLSDARRAFDEKRFLQPLGKKDRRCDMRIAYVAAALEALLDRGDVLNGV